MTSKIITDVYKQSKHTRPALKAENIAKAAGDQQPDQPCLKSDEALLRDFDLTLEYGPTIGISRLQRWERAHKHGLNPPLLIRDIIWKHSNNDSYTESIWKDYNI